MARSNTDVDNMVDRILPKTEGAGFKVDVDNPTFPWVDLTGLVRPNFDSDATTSPAYGEFQPGINGLHYNINDIMDCVFHIPHEWVPNYSAEIHIHWGNNVQLEIGDSFSITPTVTYSSRDGRFGTPVILEPIAFTATEALLIHSHPVTEVPLCRATDDALYIAGEVLDRSLIEVDGLINVAFVVSQKSFSNAGKLFLFTADIHHQSTGIGTKNNHSPFYGEV